MFLYLEKSQCATWFSSSVPELKGFLHILHGRENPLILWRALMWLNIAVFMPKRRKYENQFSIKGNMKTNFQGYTSLEMKNMPSFPQTEQILALPWLLPGGGFLLTCAKYVNCLKPTQKICRKCFVQKPPKNMRENRLSKILPKIICLKCPSK